MIDPRGQSILDYYERELAYLRSSGAAFARQYPRIAAALELGEHESADPHVERLLESFAFLTARIQRQLDDAVPNVPAAMLEVLHPCLVRPFPSTAIVEFVADGASSDLGEGYRIDRGMPLFVRNEEGRQCRFKTAFDIELWPVEIAGAEHLTVADIDGVIDDPTITSLILLKLETASQDIDFGDLPLDRLRLHLSGERSMAFRLLETLLLCNATILVRLEGQREFRKTGARLRPVGFDEDEGLLPGPDYGNDGYRLIQEFFAFPDKHLFIDIAGIGRTLKGHAVEIAFGLEASDSAHFKLNAESFKLHAAPAINLFEVTSEPVRLDETRHEYRLVPDHRSQDSTEIYAINHISCSSDHADTASRIAPFYSCDHTREAERPSCFWITRREAASEERGGTNIFISFVDLELDLDTPPTRSVYADTLCTNRHAANRIPSGTEAEIEVDAPVSAIRFVTKPCRQIDPPTGAQTLWRLVSHLSLNHLSIENGRQGLVALKEILRLYSFIDPAFVDRQLAGLRSLETAQTCHRIQHQVWRGFCFGTKIDLTVDPKAFVGSSALVLGYLLERFLALYAVCNSFTQLNLYRTDKQGIWHAWPPRSGDQPLI